MQPLNVNRPMMSPKRLGDYRQVASRVAPPSAARAPQPLPQPPLAQPRPSFPAQQAPAASEGLFARLMAWLKRFFAPAPAPTPTPTPPPTPRQPGPQAFFTNTYASPLQGMDNAQVRMANEATAHADPNNPDKQLIALIDSVGPGGTLDGAFFSIGVDNVVDALCRAAQRGVKVRLATEADYYQTPDGSALRDPIQKLKAAGVTIIPDDRSGSLMHDKFLIANGQTVWTGSYNITEGGTYHENNNAIRFDSPELAAHFQHEFDKMFVHGNFGPDTDNGSALDDHPSPKTVQIGTTEVTTYFSPSRAAQAGAKGALMDELAKAQKRIQFLAFSYTDDEIGQLMLNKAQAGVKVEGVFEKSQAASRYSEYKTLNAAEAATPGLDVRIDTNPALMHHKVMIIDDSTLIMGSFNFSDSAHSSNNENMLVIKNAPDLVKAYQEEFARIQNISID